MKDTLHFKPLTHKNNYVRSSLTQDTLFVDIETSGLSAEKNHIYCIGCSYLTNDQLAVRLLFAETENEESLILQKFVDLCSGFHQLITFNGTTFDLPFPDCQSIGGTFPHRSLSGNPAFKKATSAE